MRRLLFLALFLSINTGALPVTLVLHGSMSASDAWYQKGGKFYEALKEEVLKRNDELESFAWSGGVTASSIIKASEELVVRLLSYPATEPITLVAHSNGGNVCLYATTILAALREELTAPLTIQPRKSLYRPFVTAPFSNKRSLTSILDADIKKLIDEAFLRLQQHFARRIRRNTYEHSYMIQALYLMGTPIDTSKFDADMSIIKHLFNLYSCKDYIQPLVGSQTISTHKRRTNLHVMVHNPSYKDEPVAPCHKHIRNPIIGKWLLRLPEVIGDDLNDGYLVLHAIKKPTFQTSPPHDHECDPDDDDDIF